MSQGGQGSSDIPPGAPRPDVTTESLLAKLILFQQSKVTRSSTGVSEKTESETYRKAFEDNEAQKHLHRGMLTPALRNITQFWMIAVVLLLVWQGFGSKIGFFHLSDSVLITLLTTTTANVLGLFYLALKYLYANPEFKAPDISSKAPATKAPDPTQTPSV